MIKIKHSNTDVKKLWNLVDNGVIDKRTVNDIFKNNEDGYIVFNSRRTYELFNELKYTSLALFNKHGE